MVIESLGMLLENLIIGVEHAPRGGFEGLIEKLGAITKALERNGAGGVFRVVFITMEDLLEDM